MKRIMILLTVLIGLPILIIAQDVITFEWEPRECSEYRNEVHLQATGGQEFTIDWGDGSEVETETGTGKKTHLTHAYNGTGTYRAVITASSENCRFTSLVFNNAGCGNDFYPLHSLDVSGCSALISLHCQYKQLKSLNLKGCTALTALYCGDNLLSSLDLTDNTELTHLNFLSNQLTGLDVGNNTKLVYLNCNYNRLTSLDLSTNIKLTNLDCGNNPLTGLDLDNNPALGVLYCSLSQLKELDISHNPALSILRCPYNELSSLDVTHNDSLFIIDCRYNSITKLDVSRNKNLMELTCGNNQLESLDVHNNLELRELTCENNHLTNLDLDKDVFLWCWNNHLPLSHLFAISETINTSTKCLGMQTLSPQIVNMGDVLFSEQSVFDNIFTNYVVTKDDIPASETDYTVIDGKLIFNAPGSYTVTMTNEAIISQAERPAEVIVEVTVQGGSGIRKNTMHNIRVSPNPTNGVFRVEDIDASYGNSEMKLFDATGRLLLTQKTTDESIDISHLPPGIYYLQIDKATSRIIKH